MTAEAQVALAAELVVAPVAFSLAAVHLLRACGAARAVRELVVLSVYGFAVERMGVAWFDRYDYGPGFLLAPLGVPIAVALVWSAVLVSAEAMAAAAVLRPLAVAAVATGLGLLLDGSIEGVARRALLWTWTPPGDVLGAPLGNFVGWACIIFPWVAVRRMGGGPLLAGTAGSAVLLAAGTAWNGLDLESKLHRAGPALVGLAATAALVALARRRRPLPRLAAATALTLLVGFAVFALALGEYAVARAGLLGLLGLAAAIAVGRTPAAPAATEPAPLPGPLPDPLLTHSGSADTLECDAQFRPRRVSCLPATTGAPEEAEP